MTTSELIESYCVMVNGGSGVLVSAMSQEYSYVLTAKHVIEDNTTDHVIKDNNGETLRILDIFFHPDASHQENYDCCVIQIEHVPIMQQQVFLADSLPYKADITLVGFPNTERESTTPIKHYNGHMTNVSSGLIICNLEGIPDKDTILGMSGGGLYYICDNQPYLVGLEFGMDNTYKEQQHGRIQCLCLNRFEEIISANGKAAMVPAYLECFSRLTKSLFGFNVIEQKSVENLKTELLNFANNLISQGMPSPYELMETYKNDLLIGAYRPDEEKDKELWIAYFEFLIICALIDNIGVVDSAYIKDLERKRRMIYTSDGSNWIGKLEPILKAARRLLDKNGTIIVASPELGAELLPQDFRIDNIIENIALIPNAGPLALIDQVESSIYKSFFLRHLEGLRKECVVRAEMDFWRTEAGVKQLRLFKENFNAFIK